MTIMKKYSLMIIAAFVAIATTTTMDFTGYFNFSALILAPLTLIFWMIYQLSKEELGISLSSLKNYGIALLYPAVVLGGVALIGFAFQKVSIQEQEWTKAWTNIAITSTLGIIIVIVTEEGFFRGWLWGALRKKGLNADHTLLVTSLCFTLWHISPILSPTDYNLPWQQVPIYLSNAMLLGLIWGLLRQISGSVIVSSVSHAVWNAIAYNFFGYGEKSGL